MKKFTKTTYNSISKIVHANKNVENRIKALQNKGFNIVNVSMGSGGVLQIKKQKSRILVQISSGHGKYNYAYAVALSF